MSYHRRGMLLISIVLLLSNFYGNIFSQQRQLHGVVYLLGHHDEKIPAKNIPVWIEETGDKDITTETGNFRIFLKDYLQPDNSIVLQIEKKGYQIIIPAGGHEKVPLNPNMVTIKIELDTLGSHRFLSREAFNLLIEKMSNSSNEQRNKDNSKDTQKHDRCIKDWAKNYGFSFDQVKVELYKWADEIEKNNEDIHSLGLASYYKKNFTQAAKYFGQSSASNQEKLRKIREENIINNKLEKDLKIKVFDDYNLLGDSYFDNNQLPEALEAYKNALKEAFSAQKKAGIEMNIANALCEQGSNIKGSEGDKLIAEGIAIYKTILSVQKNKYPTDWALTNGNLGSALASQASRKLGTEGISLLKEALMAYKDALTVKAKDSLSFDRVKIMFDIGETLREQGQRTEGSEGLKLLKESIDTLKKSFNLIKNKEQAVCWDSLNGLGGSLFELGQRTEGIEGINLLKEAVIADKNALLIDNSAIRIRNLGTSLFILGKRLNGSEGKKIIKEANTVYQNAILAYLKAKQEEDWILAMKYRCEVLKDLGIRTEGNESIYFFEDAVTTYKKILTKRTMSNNPQDWAETKVLLGHALRKLGVRKGGLEGKQFLNEAVQSFKDALTVYVQNDFSSKWSGTMDNLGNTYFELEDWNKSLKYFIDEINIKPSDKVASDQASFIYHEKLFEFTKAFVLDSTMVMKYNYRDIPTISKFAEKLFTVEKYVDADDLISTNIINVEKDSLLASYYILLKALQIAIMLELNKKESISENIDHLISFVEKQPADFNAGRKFDGTKYFIRNSKTITKKQWLLSLLSALEETQRNLILDKMRLAKKELLNFDR